MSNRYFEYTEDVIVVLNRSSEHKKRLRAGLDFLYIEKSTFLEMQLGNDDYLSFNNRGKEGVHIILKRKGESSIRLSRVIMDVIDKENLVVSFANNHSYDLRKGNQIVYQKGQRNIAESQRVQKLEQLTELPEEIDNVLVTENGSSQQQELLDTLPPSITFKEEITLSINVNGGTVKIIQLTEEEKSHVYKVFQSIGDRITVCKA